MSDSRPMNGTAEEARVGKEELISATELLRAMLKTAKAFRMYLPNNPLRQKFIDESTEKTIAHLDRYDRCQLDVAQFSILYQGTRIYENRDPKESFAFRMHSDGIRSIQFGAGIAAEEICDFLDIVGQDRPADTDDDIVTLLWMKDLPHVSYLLAEDYLEVDEGQGAVPAPASQREGLSKVYSAPPEVPEPPSRPQNIQPLTAEETAALQTETTQVEERDPVQEVMTILASILAGEEELGLFAEFLEIGENLLANLFHAGRLGMALRLVQFLRKMETNASVAVGKRELIRAGRGRHIPAEAVLALQQPIDAAADLAVEDLAEIFRYLGVRHMGTICELLGKIQQMKMRKVAISALVEAGREMPRVFYPFLRDRRWYLVRNIVLILHRLGDRESLEMVAPLAGHKELQVRKEVFTYLVKHPDPQAREALMRFLQDESEPLRIRALQILGGAKFAPALKPVEAMVAANDFAEKSLQEKCTLYGVLGALAGDSVVPHLQRMATRRYWLQRAKQDEFVACAVAGLRQARTAAALEALKKVQARRRGGAVATLIARALKELEREGEWPAPPEGSHD